MALIIGLSVVGVIVLIILILVIWYISTMNRIRRMQINIDESLSGIDVALNKRFDLLTKQLGATKGYMEHEKETLSLVTQMRAGIPTNNEGARDVAKMQEFNSNLDKIASAVNMTFEKYPDLRASENVAVLQASIVDVEEHLQAARRLYNNNVSTYNKYIIVFPNSIVAHRIAAEPRQFFNVEEGKSKDVEIKF